MNDPVLDIIRSEVLEPPDRVNDILDAIEAKHKDRVLAFVYYGSSLREMSNPEKMLDFYVLVDSYSAVHGSGLRALLNRLIPPAVYYIEKKGEDGILSTCKYSILSLREFERRCTGKVLQSQIWGRFSQPCILLRAKDEIISERVCQARVSAVRYMASQSAPLVAPKATASEIWGRGFYESYRTELRPESSVERSKEIVERFSERYEALTTALYGQPNNSGQYDLTGDGKAKVKRLWFWRRVQGKPLSIVRILNSAATFDGGLDYVLRKLNNHSGVEYQPTKFQRKHPILASPIMGWQLWRKGAFR